MNEQDTKAFNNWISTTVFTQQVRNINEFMEIAWQAACEYKDAQLAAKDAVIAKLREALEVASDIIGSFLSDNGWTQSDMNNSDWIGGVLATSQNDDTALQEMLKQAKRDLLINLADHFDRKGWYQAPNDLRRMAGEIK